jgi:hypothetical protein
VAVIRTLAFAELDTPSLGVAWIPDDGAAALIALRVGPDARVATGRLNDGARSEPWRIDGDGVSLLFSPAGPAAHGGPPDARVASVDQLCEVTGSVLVDGAERSISCIGSRASLEAGFDLASIESFRQTAGWFSAADGLSLLSYRPAKSKGQDADLVAATVLEPEAPPIADPRLSTTYNAAGLPARVGLELWFEPEDSGEDSGGDEQRHFPRRAAAEPVGEPIEWEVADFRLHAAMLRWHSRGNNGAGMYLLGQRG